jgi:hypothetical protein
VLCDGRPIEDEEKKEDYLERLKQTEIKLTNAATGRKFSAHLQAYHHDQDIAILKSDEEMEEITQSVYIARKVFMGQRYITMVFLLTNYLF